MKGVIFLESGVLTPADFTVLTYVITNAPHLVKDLSIMPCLLYEEFIEDKWKSKDIDYTDVLLSSFNPFQVELREQEMYNFEQMNFNREQ